MYQYDLISDKSDVSINRQDLLSENCNLFFEKTDVFLQKHHQKNFLIRLKKGRGHIYTGFMILILFRVKIS